jgi:hypothetical protein
MSPALILTLLALTALLVLAATAANDHDDFV